MARAKAAPINTDKKLESEVKKKLAERPEGKAGNLVIAVGGDGCEGLSLQVAMDGRKSWILRAIFPDGRRREMGLGTYPHPVGLADARDKAREARKLIAEGRDPIAERKEAKAAARAIKAEADGPKLMTFREAVRAFCHRDSGQLNELSNPKHAAQWPQTLMTYAAGEDSSVRRSPRNRSNPKGIGKDGIGDKLVADLTKHDIARVLEPIWNEIPETARRVRARIEAVIRWADGKEERDRANPAQWSDLKHLGAFVVRRGQKRKALDGKKRHHPALQVQHARAWFADLRTRPSSSAKALEFTALTACRSQEVRGARWSEFDGLDGDSPIWTVPGERMKMGAGHRVPLSRQAVALLQGVPRHQGNDLVFVAPRGGALGDMALSKTMKDRNAAKDGGNGQWKDSDNGKPATPHGLRATFRTWVQEETNFPREIAEAALAHVSGDEVERAYARGDALARRRELMQAWADFLTGKADAVREAAE